MINIVERPTVKVPGITSLFITFDYQKIIVDELKLLPTTFFNPDTKEWEIPITQLSEFIDRVCIYDNINLKLYSNDAKSYQKYELGPYKTEPFKHQLEGIEFGLNHDNWLLLDSPGLGKTLQITYLAQELKERYNIQHCLIICGINTLKTNWKMEIEKHSNLSCRILGQRINRKGRLVVDGISERLKQLQNPIEEFFVITNIETLRDDKIFKALQKNKFNKFDMMVVDEIHCCKNPNSQQGKHLLKLNNSKFKIGLTGTLLMNNPLDTYVPLKWIGAEKATYTNFKYYYCNFGGPFNQILVGFKNIPHLKYHLEKYSLRRTKDILDLPPKTIINEYVDMNDTQMSFYNNIKEGIISQVDKVTIKQNAALLGMVARFRQASVLPSILTTEDIKSSKIERAIDLTEQLISAGEKVVIFSTFKAPVYELQQLLSKYNVVIATGDQKDDDIERAKYQFQNDPNTKLFIGTWSKCGTGITLNAASYMIFLDTPFTWSVYEQAQDRIHRIGSQRPVFIYNLIAKETIDERVLEIVNDKKALSNYIIDDEITQSGLDSLRKYIEDMI